MPRKAFGHRLRAEKVLFQMENMTENGIGIGRI